VYRQNLQSELMDFSKMLHASYALQIGIIWKEEQKNRLFFPTFQVGRKPVSFTF